MHEGAARRGVRRRREGASVDWKRDEDARREALRKPPTSMFAGAAESSARSSRREQGKPLAEAGVEAFGAGMWLKYFADLEVPT